MSVSEVVAGGIRFRDSVLDSIREHTLVWIQAALLLLPLAVMYADTFTRLAGDWWNDPNNSHGIMIPPLALYFAWRKRHRFAAEPAQPAIGWGLFVVIGSLFVYLDRKSTRLNSSHVEIS